MASLLDRAKALYGGDSPVSMFNIPERFTKVDDRGLPPDPLNRNLGTTIQNDPIIQGISGAVDALNANQAAGFQDWLKTPAGRIYTLANAQNKLRGQIPTTPLGQSLADPAELSKLTAAQEALATAQEAVATEARQPTTAVPPVTEKTEDLTPEAQTFNTAATVVSPEGAEDKQNWFDAVNDRVDLMAMGAAMLAGSGQRGATTMSRLGQGLQAGLASRAAQAKAAEDKEYTDALLVLKAMEQRRLSAKDRAAGLQDPLTVREAIDGMASEFTVAGANPDNTKMISTYFQTRPALKSGIDSLAPNQRGVFMSEFVSKGQGWVGDKIETNNINKAYNDALVIARKVKPTGVN